MIYRHMTHELSQLNKIKSFSNDYGDGNGNENVNQFNWPFKPRVGCPFTGDVFADVTVGVAAPWPSPCSAFSRPSRLIHYTSGTMDRRLTDQFSFWFSEIVVLCKFYLEINLWLDSGIPLILNGPLGKQVVATVPSLTVVGRTLSFHMQNDKHLNKPLSRAFFTCITSLNASYISLIAEWF